MAHNVRSISRHAPARSTTVSCRHQARWFSSSRYLSFKYKYSPLNEGGRIRLLRLLPGSSGSPIKCEFLPVDLATSAQDYHAVSYTWGDPALNRSIECEHNELNVTDSVRELLDQLRSPDKDNLIWIDAICIDQQNLEERSKQVKLMGQIYSSAKSVDIWLGSEHDESALLEEFIPRLAEVFRAFPRSQLYTDEGLFQKTKTSRNSPEWKALKHLFKRPWFNRTWVVQEIVASSQHTFICGKHHIPADLLVRVARELRGLYLNGNAFVRYYGFDHATISKFLRMARIWRERQNGLETYFSLLTYSFWTSEASDPKDKIFSMVGLDIDMAMRVEPDYQDSVQTVYTKATQESLLSGKSIGILSLAGIGNHRVLESLPSWVPDFSTTTIPPPPFELFSYEGSVKDKWAAHKIPIFEETLSPFLFRDNELTVDAINVDSIKSLGSVLDIANQQNLNAWAREAESLFLTSKYYLLLENPDWNIHWRSLIADRVFEHAWYIRAPPQLYSTYYAAFRKQLAMRTNTRDVAQRLYIPEPTTGDANNMHARRFVAALWQSAHGRRYVVTSRGDVALVPRHAKVGDEICLLGRCNAPFVIRKVGRGGKTVYKLVGDCYVHGIMRGKELDVEEVERITLV